MRNPRIIVAALLLALGLAACGSDEGDLDEPPCGLHTVELLNDASSVEAVMASMPEQVDGLAR
jgi:hypothetical protein